MTPKPTLRHALPDGTVAIRKTDRTYTHVVVGKLHKATSTTYVIATGMPVDWDAHWALPERKRPALRREVTLLDAGVWCCLSYHGSLELAEKEIRKQQVDVNGWGPAGDRTEMRVEALNHGVRPA